MLVVVGAQHIYLLPTTTLLRPRPLIIITTFVIGGDLRLLYLQQQQHHHSSHVYPNAEMNSVYILSYGLNVAGFGEGRQDVCDKLNAERFRSLRR